MKCNITFEDDYYKTAEITDIGATELLILNAALARYANDKFVHEKDRAIALRMGNEIKTFEGMDQC